MFVQNVYTECLHRMFVQQSFLCADGKISYYNTLVFARGFPRCKPNRIPDKLQEDKMLENKVSENRKPDKMSDNLNRTLTLTGSGPFMSLFTLSLSLTHTLYLSTLSPYLYS